MVADAIQADTERLGAGVMAGLGRHKGGLIAVSAALVVALAVASKGVISSSDLKVSLDTVASVSGCFAAAVALARSRRVDSLSSRILAFALIVAATSMVLFVTVPTIVDKAPGVGLGVARTLSNVACAALLACIALVPPSRPAGRRWERRLMPFIVSERRLIWVGIAASLAIGVVGEIVASPPSLKVCYAIAAVVFGAAAVSLAARASSSARATFAWWLALSSIFGAGTMLALLLGGTVQPNAVSLADLLRAGSLVALGAGGVSELAAIRTRDRAHARDEERRRVASDLHDGVAQELSYIAVQARYLAALYPDTPGLEEIRSAAELALADCRIAIAGCPHSTMPTLAAAIELRARPLARRSGLELTLDVADDVATSAEAEHEVVSIVREAISNAARHSGGTLVAISLRRRDGAVVVRVSDNGRGFEPEHPLLRPSQSGGYGLASMRERAWRLGGDLVLESRPGAGTTIELSFP